MWKKLQTIHPAAAALTVLNGLTLVFVLSVQRRLHVASGDACASAVTVREQPQRECDIFRGEWVLDDDDGGLPYYTNLSCPYIQEHQNCMKYGRPDRGFLRWRWRPDGCELPRFDAGAFLDAVRGRSLAFVGDSLARNHMQSLMCLLSKVERPIDISTTTNLQFRTIMRYESHNFTLAVFWSPFLVRASESQSGSRLWHLHLDEPEEAWVAGVAGFDYVVLSASTWFHKPSVFYEAGRVSGCHSCLLPGVPDLTRSYSLRVVFRAALRALTVSRGFNGTVIVRTESPMHFEGGQWDKGGDCRRTRPLAANETLMADWDLYFHRAQVEEFARAKKAAAAAAGGGSGAKLLLLDSAAAMLLRPDGHPSRYGHWPHENVTYYNDCVHWCLPGPVDVWNEMLLQMLLRPDQFDTAHSI